MALGWQVWSSSQSWSQSVMPFVQKCSDASTLAHARTQTHTALLIVGYSNCDVTWLGFGSVCAVTIPVKFIYIDVFDACNRKQWHLLGLFWNELGNNETTKASACANKDGPSLCTLSKLCRRTCRGRNPCSVSQCVAMNMTWKCFQLSPNTVPQNPGFSLMASLIHPVQTVVSKEHVTVWAYMTSVARATCLCVNVPSTQTVRLGFSDTNAAIQATSLSRASLHGHDAVSVPGLHTVHIHPLLRISGVRILKRMREWRSLSSCQVSGKDEQIFYFQTIRTSNYKLTHIHKIQCVNHLVNEDLWKSSLCSWVSQFTRYICTVIIQFNYY